MRERAHAGQHGPVDAAAVAAGRAHHLEFLVQDHRQFLDLLDVPEEGQQVFAVRPPRRVAVGAADRVHGQLATGQADVPLRGRTDHDQVAQTDGEAPVGVRLTGQQPQQDPQCDRTRRSRVDPGDQIATDDEVGTLPTADLVLHHPLDHVGVGEIVDCERRVEQARGRLRQGVHEPGQGRVVQRRAPVGDQAAQRGTVVMAGEPALAHLPERDGRQHRRLPGGRQRDVVEVLDVQHLAGEQLEAGGAPDGARPRSRGRGRAGPPGPAGHRGGTGRRDRLGRAWAPPGVEPDRGARTRRRPPRSRRPVTSRASGVIRLLGGPPGRQTHAHPRTIAQRGTFVTQSHGQALQTPGRRGARHLGGPS